LSIGQVISVAITAVDIENNKISLSKKLADEELGYYTPEEPQYDEVDEPVEDTRADDVIEGDTEENQIDNDQVDNDEVN